MHVLLCTHYRPLQFFSTYFWKSKEIRVLQPIFPDMIVLVTMLMLLKFSLFLSSIVEALPFSPCAVYVLSYLAIAVAKRPLSSNIWHWQDQKIFPFSEDDQTIVLFFSVTISWCCLGHSSFLLHLLL